MVHTLRHLFTPHHTNNNRARVLHPAGLAVMIGVMVLWQSVLEMTKYSMTELPSGMVLGFASNIFADDVVVETNTRRNSQGLAPLTVNSTLAKAAAAKANHMFQNNYWAHIAPDGTTPWVFISQAGYQYAVAGENLARDFGDTQSMVEAWMNSPTHKENIVNPKYTEIGIAVVDGILEGTETTLVVQMFGAPARASAGTTATAAKTEASPTPGPTQNPTPMPTAGQLAALTQENPPDRTEASGQSFRRANVFSPLTLTKAVGAAVLILLSLVLVYDEHRAHKRNMSRRIGKNWAHLALLAMALMILNMVSQGKVPIRVEQVNMSVEAND